jgi:hypothetical protein
MELRADRAGPPIAVLQRLHPTFAGRVCLDLEAVTSHLAARGLATPRLVRTRAGAAWHDHEGSAWRALTWIDGATVHRLPDARWAEAAGALVGRFHAAVADLRHDYAHTRAGVHDTPAHLARLAALVAAAEARPAEGAELIAGIALGREILGAATALPPLPGPAAVPLRHCHGDLKISNLLFSTDPPRGVCLVDLDTLGRSTLAFELGDALRSWCNPRGEDAGEVALDLELLAAALRGFRAEAGALISPLEWRSIVAGLETICLELAARFAIDVFCDDYFGWDAARFPSRRAHNLVRARGQLALGRAVRGARDEALAIALSGQA